MLIFFVTLIRMAGKARRFASRNITTRKQEKKTGVLLHLKTPSLGDLTSRDLPFSSRLSIVHRTNRGLKKRFRVFFFT